ncbi:MAG: metal-sensing transcriptional repressor [Candidatus Latescibacteria bacterium]|nr:metal-sensing transcriptional repressor [Candidatus Latescibacterota bacterium]
MHEANDDHRLMRRLQIIEGQIKGVKRMVEEEAHPSKILTQMSAVRAAIAGAASVLVGSHLRISLADIVARDGDPDEVDDVMDSLKLFGS